MCDPADTRSEEGELIRRLQKGDADAFDGIFEMHRRAIYAFAAGMVGDRWLAEDIVQEAFIELVRHIGRIDAERGSRAWLFRVARNRAIDALRKRAPEVRSAEPAPTGGPVRQAQGGLAEGADERAVASPADALMGDEQRAAVAKALERLEPREREVLMLHFYGDLTFREVAAVVKRPLGTVLWLAQRGLGRLAGILGREEGFGGRTPVGGSR